MSESCSYRLIGDPHITRKFEVGVPLARRGEREAYLFEDFKDRLYEGNEPVLIMVGDLLEKPICSIKDLHAILSMILEAARARPERLFIYLAGNHDRSPQQDAAGGFDVLTLFDQMLPNLRVLIKPEVINEIALFPWEWDRTALEQIEDVRGKVFKIAVGHWDLVAYDTMHCDHFCPARHLVDMGCEKIHSGHWHVKGTYKIDGIEVDCTGSMQPMTHAEDPESKLYVTLSLEEYLETDPETLKDKYVRVQADIGEEVEPLADCLGFKIQRQETQDGDEYGEVLVEGFELTKVIKKNFEKHEVSEEVDKFIKDRLNVDD